METFPRTPRLSPQGRHGSYLQGMETYFPLVPQFQYSKRTRILPTRNGNILIPIAKYSLHSLYTDPTYKEWKPNANVCFEGGSSNTDPTYKEWKQLSANPMVNIFFIWTRILPTRNGNSSLESICITGIVTRILPTRNGNPESAVSRPKISRINTDPTYKEWKPNKGGRPGKKRLPHGSYLQGIETSVRYRLPLRTPLHGSYLQGMETCQQHFLIN